MSLYTQDVSQVAVQIISTGLAGEFEIAGGEKEKVTYKRNSPLWNKKVDTSGGMHRGANPDKSGELVINLLKTNPQNALMQILACNIDSPLAELGLDTFNINIIDRLTGHDLVIARNCFIEEQPEGSIETEVPELKWKIQAAELYIFERGGKVSI